jgi:CHAT domain-containing protein
VLSPILLAAAIALPATAASRVPSEASGQPPPAGRQDPDAELKAIEEIYRQAHYREAAERLLVLRARADLTAAQRARLLLRLAAAQVELGQYEQALSTADEAATHADRAKDSALLARIEIARGSAWRFRGFPHRGISHYNNALRQAERSGQELIAADALNVLASVSQELGDWSRSLDYAQRSFEAMKTPTDAMRFSYLVNRGIAYYEFYDGPRAEASFRDALAIARQRGNRREESFALGELGLVAWAFDEDLDAAAALFEQAIALAHETGVIGLEATWLNNLGGVHRDAGRLEQALTLYRHALELEESGGRSRERAVLLKNIGQVLALQGRFADAERSLRMAIEESESRNAARIRWMARMELAGVYAARGDARADTYFSAALDVLEAQQSTVLLERFRVGTLGRNLAQYDPYDRYIQFLVARGDASRGFEVSERARARVFLETLAGARDQIATAIPDAFVRDEAVLLERISSTQAALRTAAGDADARARLIASLDEAEDALTALRLRLAVDHPAPAHGRFPRIWQADEFRREVLGADEVLATFFLGEQASYCWLIRRDTVDVVALPARAEIERRTRQLLPTLQSPRVRVDEEARTWLSRTLIAPIVARIGAEQRLLIVPHAILSYLPFEVLRAGDDELVIERYTVSYSPSVSSLAYLRQRGGRPSPEAAVIAVGNPATNVADPASERRTPLEWIGRLKPLPYSELELQHIAGAFRDNVQVLQGASATEPALRDALSRQSVAIVHFATHAFIDESRPHLSGLVLSPSTVDDDGLLQARDVYGLSLPAALVTLSGCETALGRQVTGEGIVGIARAFFFAGAQAVTATLWSVSDRSTAALMRDFYARVRAGGPVDGALADVKRARIRQGREEAHPYYWAPFVISGDARVALTFAAGGPEPSPLLIVMLVVAAAGVLLAFRRRRQRGL